MLESSMRLFIYTFDVTAMMTIDSVTDSAGHVTLSLLLLPLCHPVASRTLVDGRQTVHQC